MLIIHWTNSLKMHLAGHSGHELYIYPCKALWVTARLMTVSIWYHLRQLISFSEIQLYITLVALVLWHSVYLWTHPSWDWQVTTLQMSSRMARLAFQELTDRLKESFQPITAAAAQSLSANMFPPGTTTLMTGVGGSVIVVPRGK